MGLAASPGLTAWGQLQARALGCPESPKPGAWGKIRPQVLHDGCRIHGCPSALGAGVPSRALPAASRAGFLLHGGQKERGFCWGPLPPWVLGALRNAPEAHRRGGSGASRHIPFRTGRKAAPGNVLSPPALPLLVIRDLLVDRRCPSACWNRSKDRGAGTENPG